ncbi:MAG: sugar phosphate isomerase/epimerase [Clostridia bacterium]|nr:sugar phosphate isomerase/epimerase [Clostridia bacterium]
MKKLEKIGVQLYTVREYMQTETQIKETFQKLKQLGYDQVQTAGCAVPYDVFGALAADAGLEIVGTHDDFDMMCNDFAQAYGNHEHLHTKLMGTGGFGFGKTQNSKMYEEFAQKANAVGEKIAAKGGKFTYHNHSHEFVLLENGKTGMEILVEELNPETTSFVLDTYWVQNGGGDVRHWIEMLTGRIDILHLKDMKILADGTHAFAEVGSGNLYWDGILQAAQAAGVSYYVVEQDTCDGDPFDSLQKSSEYLHKNFM